MVWYGMVWCDKARHGTSRYDMVLHGLVWYGTVRYGVVWYGLVWAPGMVWHAWHHMEFYCLVSGMEVCLSSVIKLAFIVKTSELISYTITCRSTC